MTYKKYKNTGKNFFKKSTKNNIIKNRFKKNLEKVLNTCEK